MRMKYFSMFSGIGGFEYGIERAVMCLENERQPERPPFRGPGGHSEQLHKQCPEGLSCIGFSELDKYATQIYKRHFPNHKEYGDVTKIDWSRVEDFDFLVGGFPCQAFSIAGKRAGFSDTRGTLFFEVARCLREKQPRFCVLENVKGLLSHDKGLTFATILSTLDELGYDAEWQVLNSKDFGVPQNRERVFIIGHLRGTGGRKIFPIGGTNKKNICQLNKPRHSNDRVYHKEGLSPTLNTMQGGNRQPFIGATIDKKKTMGSCSIYDKGKEIANCLAARDYKGLRRSFNVITNNVRIRRLTPTECERLQGFPDGWTEGISDTQRYKCLGNAVTTNVITAIFEELLEKE